MQQRTRSVRTELRRRFTALQSTLCHPLLNIQLGTVPVVEVSETRADSRVSGVVLGVATDAQRLSGPRGGVGVGRASQLC